MNSTLETTLLLTEIKIVFSNCNKAEKKCKLQNLKLKIHWNKCDKIEKLKRKKLS